MSLMSRIILRSSLICKKSLPKVSSQRFFSQSSRLLSDRRYSEKHEWIRKEGNIGTVGISSYAEKSLGDVVYVQLPEVGDTVSANDEVGAVESVKAASEIYTPVSGKICQVNSMLEEKPGLVNSSCYDEGWLFQIELNHEEEYDNLMDEKSYDEFLKTAH